MTGPTTTLPAILEGKLAPFPIDDDEGGLLRRARQLLDAGFPPHALLDLWSAAVNNLRRRVERYGVEMFVQAVEDEPGRKKYDRDGEHLTDRWGGVDDLVVVAGAAKLGLLGRKAAKVLETINWMRNHASAAHHGESHVQQSDVVALAVMLETSLFSEPLPDPGHSVTGLFEPVKTISLEGDALDALSDQIKALPPAQLRTAFGFLLSELCGGATPAARNAAKLLAVAWGLASEEQRQFAGQRCHTYAVDSSLDQSVDKSAQTRLLEFLVQVGGVAYIPDGTRARYFRKAAQALAVAKDSSYGWSDEEAAARQLAQFGPCVPGIAFEEVYQEVLAVWFGNYWGRSGANDVLAPFIDDLDTDKLRKLVALLGTNHRARHELHHDGPRKRALTLLSEIRGRLTLAAHQDEVDTVISSL